MNQQGQPHSAATAPLLPPPRQEMEYLCAGKIMMSRIISNVNNVRKIVVPKMTSSLVSPFAAGNAAIVSCTRRERSEVSPKDPRKGCLD